MPIGRFRNYLERSGNCERYMKKLESAFNEEVVEKLMYLDAISVDWDGKICDCDFNLSMGLRCEKN